MLLALYQSLLHKAVLVYKQTMGAVIGQHREFWKWISTVAADSNNDESSKFWSRMLPFFNGYFAYFIAVRSGNWVLRNSALRAFTPLFFAYNHYKYEELATFAIIDSLTLPEDVLVKFLKGEWTVSAKGRPHHNLALDEAHECMINLRLKTITSRPSHFRTVEMANFTSYLDHVVRGTEGRLYAHKSQEPAHYKKRYVCQRATRISVMLEDIHVFEHHEEESPLCNIISPAKNALDSKSVSDLLSISEIGRDRMVNFIPDYALPPPKPGGRKRRKRSRKLATFTRKVSTNSEAKRREVTLLKMPWRYCRLTASQPKPHHTL